MGKYKPPRHPSAMAARRKGDLDSRKREKVRCSQRQGRRRTAFRTVKHRYRMVREYRGRCKTCPSEAEAARQTSEYCGIGMSTLRRYDRNFLKDGKRGLMPVYQRLSRAETALPFEIIQTILSLRCLLGWCGQRISAELGQRGIADISHMSVYRLFRRYHVRTRTYHPEGRSDGILYRCQQVKTANWTWHTDFAGPREDSGGVTRSLLTVIDSCSRMLPHLGAVPDQKSETAENILTELFGIYGTPRVIVTDRGRAFAPSVESWVHRFPDFLSEHGIEHRRTKPYYPQTNGKAEAAAKIAEREFLRHSGRKPDGSGTRHWTEIAGDISEFKAWYNFYGAHGALNCNVPARLYAGVTMPKQGVKNIFGFLPESQIETEKLPVINKENRLRNLSPVPVN